MKVDASEWPPQNEWPEAGWKHALNAHRFHAGSVFGWNESGRLWSGIVEETSTFSVKVRDVLPGVITKPQSHNTRTPSPGAAGDGRG